MIVLGPDLVRVVTTVHATISTINRFVEDSGFQD